MDFLALKVIFETSWLTFADKEVIAARPNGYMWKVEAKTGEVAKTLQFKDEDNNKLS